MSSQGRVRAVARLVAILAFVIPAVGDAAAASLKVEPLDVVTHAGVRRFQVEIADTEESRELGLMFRKSLADSRGMLFDFKVPQPVAFWMRNTLIPLDMVFIAADGRVVSVASNAKPLDDTPIPSGGDVLGVLEIRGGLAKELGIEAGDRVRERIFSH